MCKHICLLLIFVIFKAYHNIPPIVFFVFIMYSKQCGFLIKNGILFFNYFHSLEAARTVFGGKNQLYWISFEK